MNDVFSRIEAAIRRDPGRRGLLGEVGGPLGRGELEAAARSLATDGVFAVIVTGFYIPWAEPAAAETDGPPGAVALAETLRSLGGSALLVTDPFCGSALQAAARSTGLPDEVVLVMQESDEFRELLERPASPVTHIIAIERVGPGYSEDVVRTQCGEAAARQFASCVPQEMWSRCLNMRGQPIEDWTVDFSAIFESPPAGVITIGLGDGGNEIGLGKFRWSDLRNRIESVADPRILCRIPANYAIVAGTSNWAAYGLAASTAVAAGRPEAFASVTPESQRLVLEAMVRDGPAVDGVSRRPETTVDGLPLLTFLEPLEAIHRRIGELKNPPICILDF